MNIAVGRQYRDRDGDTWTVMDDGMLVWDKSAYFSEPLIQSFRQCESERGPLRRTVEYPLDVDLDELDVNPHEADAPQNGHDHDPVNHPQHYVFPGGHEVINISEHLTSNAGQAVQYLSRACRIDGKVKGSPAEDMRKAIWFAQRELARLEAAS